MAYTINFTNSAKTDLVIEKYQVNGPQSPNNAEPILSADSSLVDPDTSLVIYGRGHPNYGERIQEDLLWMLENFWSDTPPVRPTAGQMWFFADSGTPDTNQLRVFRATDNLNPDIGGEWTNANNVYSSNFTPVNETYYPAHAYNNPVDYVVQTEGSLWYDTSSATPVEHRLRIFNGTTSTWQSLGYVAISGDTMTGPLILDADPTVALGAVTKQYVDTHISDTDLHLSAAQNLLLDDFESIHAIVVGGGLEDMADQLVALHDFETDGSVHTGPWGVGPNDRTVELAKVNIDGDTMTGFLTLSADPTANLHAATKQYVDSTVGGAGYLPVTGGTMTGDITMTASSTVTGIPAATNPTDAVSLQEAEEIALVMALALG